MGEYSLMSWVQLVAIIGSLATSVSIFVTMTRNNKSIDKDLGTIKVGMRDLAQDHVRILELQHSISSDQALRVQNISAVVENIKERMAEDR
ncbi:MULTISPECIES: hypothetical protein [Leuconostoc]|uniref:Holin n=2 Tax=Leuconostoc inhae TaxID=178001 RepID=A0ABM9V7M6_9LACO|nr:MULTISPECIES: hypothetical protein [Leuconostoc]MBZ5947823.1 hypothetical protein [Leuconostoc gasicomitatum]MBZ5955689.1 hypothetical protein [Leuconostoc gasicomitatum]MBZ5960693.1 hypothetical protein [Leuconostoc gasicomitatum]MBZ5979927.1 hypothetical protein [Leuconostoc gasicomitatum]MBZ5983303.1 hypothetical protein [Leuconostoc gasicomitatum]